MGYVTDGGLEPEPDVSIRAVAHCVNRFLAPETGKFGLILGRGMAVCRKPPDVRGRMGWRARRFGGLGCGQVQGRSGWFIRASSWKCGGGWRRFYYMVVWPGKRGSG